MIGVCLFNTELQTGDGVQKDCMPDNFIALYCYKLQHTENLVTILSHHKKIKEKKKNIEKFCCNTHSLILQNAWLT